MKLTRCVYYLSALLLTALLPTSVNAAPTFPGRNSSIVFTKSHNETTDIWIMNAHGKRERLLVRNAHQPTWSPNGRTLAFIKKHPKGDRLQTIRAEGGHQRSLTHTPGYKEHSPVWSPDGKRLAFVRNQHSASGHVIKSAIVTVKPTGTDEINVTGWLEGGQYYSPSWSPDRSRLVYQKSSGGQSELFITNLAVNDTQRLTVLSDDIVANVSWSPNGKKILYNDSYGQVYTIWPDGSHRTVISDGESFDAAWSPDGNRIVFIEHPTDDSISLSEPDGTVVQLPIQKGQYSTISRPLWSPDGTKLAIILASSAQNAGIFVFDLSNNPVPTEFAKGAISEMSWRSKR